MVPTIAVFALGGTIAMAQTNDQNRGVQPTITPQVLLQAVPELSYVARVEAYSFRQVPGAHLTLDDLAALAAEIRAVVEEGAHGVVVTQGTDTIEETAFTLGLMLGIVAPVVVTGAMRHPGLPGADGPANLLAAVRVAASPAARDRGVLVVMNDEIHAACLVTKQHTSNPAAFRSPGAGPVGWVAEDRVRIVLDPIRSPDVPITTDRLDNPVALITTGLGDDGRLLETLPGLGYKGLVIEALGAGHVPTGLVEPLTRLTKVMPVILASRTGAGETLRETYGFPGSEIDLLKRGLIPAGILDGPKARILLSLLLSKDSDTSRLADVFNQFGDPV